YSFYIRRLDHLDQNLLPTFIFNQIKNQTSSIEYLEPSTLNMQSLNDILTNHGRFTKFTCKPIPSLIDSVAQAWRLCNFVEPDFSFSQFSLNQALFRMTNKSTNVNMNGLGFLINKGSFFINYFTFGHAYGYSVYTNTYKDARFCKHYHIPKDALI